MLVPLALLSLATAILANASCSSPSTATWPVIGASMPIEAVQFLLELEPVLALLVLPPLLLLLLLEPQPAAISAASASAATVMRGFTPVPPPRGAIRGFRMRGFRPGSRRRPASRRV